MAGTKGNRRIIYTKKVISESLLELLKTNEIHKITVTDICKKADINRGTFYAHYKDPFDLLESMENNLFNKIIDYINETQPEKYKDILLLKVLELIKENKELCKIIICKQNDSRILNRILYIARNANLQQLIDSSTHSKKFDETRMEYLIKYSVGGTLAVIQNWLENDLIESPKEITEIIDDINKFTKTCF